MLGLLRQSYKFNFILKRAFSSNTKACHVCIIGGGPIGLGVSSILSSSPCFDTKKILVIEGQQFKPYKRNELFSSRTVALSPNTKDILSKCGAWKYIEEVRYQPVKKMYVWEQTSESFITFEEDSGHLAYIVENDLLQHALVQSIKDRPNVEVMYDSKVKDISLGPSQSDIQLLDGSSINAELVIGSDGFNSKVRKAANIDVVTKNNNQTAVVSVVRFDNLEENHIAWQRFTKTGPIAYLPLNKGHSNLIWSTTNDHANYLMKLDDDVFIKELNEEMFTSRHVKPYTAALHDIVKSVFQNNATNQQRCVPPPVSEVVSGSRARFPLGFLHANNYVKAGAALVGDACHRIMPLAGQGVNLGFGDAECLSRNLVEAAYDGINLGDLFTLHRYETERQRYVFPVACTIQTIDYVYQSDFVPVVLARNIGLNFVNSVSSLKEIFQSGATKGRITFGKC